MDNNLKVKENYFSFLQFNLTILIYYQLSIYLLYSSKFLFAFTYICFKDLKVSFLFVGTDIC